jgi:hypothetical protein
VLQSWERRLKPMFPHHHHHHHHHNHHNTQFFLAQETWQAEDYIT